jgi:hypothetical protein
MNHLETIAPLGGPAPEGATKAVRKPKGPMKPTRRTVLGGALAAGTGVGMAVLGIFPPARRAMADGYDILNSCPAYASSHDCTPGCGPSPVCADCCTPVPYILAGWHKDNTFTNYWLRPNECASGTYDGWNWKYTQPCAGCGAGVTWRCHDGWKWSGTAWGKTICKAGVCN